MSTEYPRVGSRTITTQSFLGREFTDVWEVRDDGPCMVVPADAIVIPREDIEAPLADWECELLPEAPPRERARWAALRAVKTWQDTPDTPPVDEAQVEALRVALVGSDVYAEDDGQVYRLIAQRMYAAGARIEVKP